MTAPAVEARRTERVQSTVGLSLAATVVAAWAACHVYGVFFHRWTLFGTLIAPLLMAIQCWLNVGLFIVAHDCMHGSLAPKKTLVNRWVGRLCLTLYAGFSYDRLLKSHHAHHRHSGTSLDPDFNDEDPEHFWRWYATFFTRYISWRPFFFIATVVFVYEELLGVGQANIVLLWAVPAIASSVQLFYFGTYLPHRHEETSFRDRHRARSNNYPWIVSLLTCFHFGYHLEHHTMPQTPWWKLPHVRGTERRDQDSAGAEPQAVSV